MRARTIAHHWKRKESLLNLKRQAERDGQSRVARRLHAIVLNMDGRSSGEIANVLKVARSNVSQWLANFERSGIDALLEGQRPGRPCGLEPAHLKTLKDIVDSGPVAYGFTGGVWTSPMVARVISEEFGRTYHPGHVRKILYALDFSGQRPRRVLARADAQKRRGWVRSTYPDIKKSPNSWGGTDPRGRSQFSPRLYTALDLGTSWSSAGSPCDRSTQSHQSVRFGGCVLREVPLPNGRGLPCSKLFGLFGAHGARLFSSAYFFGPG